ncbi:MAG: Gfo/Idh/MocA family oxidoreductase [Magnetococcales bacterium]|nr:Gfo/Idh/MocA family oxidoreductase [Magnetococcales bacterium]
MSVINFGLVGCGRIYRKHVEALRQCHLARLIAVCDPNEQRAQQSGASEDIPHYLHMEAMLDAHPEIDVINILTPSGLHAGQCVLAAQRGKNVVVEKPMALTLADAERMVKVCDANKVRLFVVKQNRFNPAIQLLRRKFEAGAFGKITQGSVRVRWSRNQAYYDQDAWRGTWKMDGGVFANQASHHVDLLQWFLGDVESVYAKTATQLVDIEVEDTGLAILKFTSGALGLIEATTATRPSDLEGSLSILGEKGTVVVGGFAVNQIETWHFGDPEERARMEKPDHSFRDVYGLGHAAFINDVCNSILNNGPALVDGLEGMKSLRLINALYESAETGKEISLVFKTHYARLGVQ